jgi:chromosome segregation ATPase
LREVAMRILAFGRLLALIVAACLGGFVIACGGGDDESSDSGSPAAQTPTDADGAPNGRDELSLEEYFEQVDVIFERCDQEIDDLNTELETTIDEATTVEDQVQALDDFLSQSVDILSGAAEDIEAIEPPDEVQDPHDAFIAAVRDGIESTEGLRDDLEGASGEAEVNRVIEQFTEEITRIQQEADTACLDLQQIADSNNIVVDLNCED